VCFHCKIVRWVTGSGGVSVTACVDVSKVFNFSFTNISATTEITEF